MTIEQLETIRYFLLFLTLFVLVGTIATMYILWHKIKINRMKTICGESCNASPTISPQSRPYLAKHRNSMQFTSLDQPSPRRSGAGSVTPPPPARSFSGQLSLASIAKVPPAERRLNKVNSQIILFGGQPYTPLYEETKPRRSHVKV